MRIFPLILTGILLLSPIASAYDQIINVADNQRYGPQLFPDQSGTRTYQFSLNENFFNVTNNITDDLAVWEAIITAQIDEEEQISSTNEYIISYAYNETWEIVYRTEYIRHSLGRWERNYDFKLYNGSEVFAECRTGEGFPVWLGGKTNPPDPWIRYQFNLNGRFGTAPSLYITFGDDQQGDKTCNLPTSVGGGIQIIMGELTSLPSVTMITFDAELYTDKLTYEFDTRRNELIEQENFNANVSAQGCEQNFIIFGFCNLVNGLKAGVDFIFGGIAWVSQEFLGRIPYVGIIFEYVGIAFSIIGELITAFLNLYFLTTEDFGLGEIFWFHVVYSASWGALIAAFTGNLIYIFKVPGWFIWYSGLALYQFFRFWFWTLPRAAIDLITGLLPG